MKPEWLEVLRLAFEEGLQDKAIAQAMYKSERMIRHYWSKIQDTLEIYPEEGKNIRSLTQIRAREIGNRKFPQNPREDLGGSFCTSHEKELL